jgi:hypothetical protein
MVITIIGSVQIDNIIFHAVSTMGYESKVVVQAYEVNENTANTYITGTIASSEQEAMKALDSIETGYEKHWGYKMLTEARSLTRSIYTY